MFQQEWMQKIQNSINEIKEMYPKSALAEKGKWQNKASKLKELCDEILDSWAIVEEQLADIFSEHPELVSDNQQEFEEEIWLNESVVRHFRQGQGYYGLTMFEDAKSMFKKVVSAEPAFALGRIYLGLSEFQERRLDEANDHFHVVAATENREVIAGFAQHMLGCIAVKRNEDREAIQYFLKAVALFPDHSDAWFNLGACHYRLGEYHEAIPCFYQALSADEDDWEAMYYLSSCYRERKEWASVSFWRLASYEKTNHPRIIESIAQDYEEMNQPEAAMHWYLRLLDVDKQNPKAYHGIAWNLWILNDAVESLTWIKRGLTLFPYDVDLLFTFVWISLIQGDTRKAEAALSHIPEDLIQEPIWIAMQSRLLSHIGNFDQAMSMAEQLMEQKKPSIQALGYYQKGRVLMESHNVTEAIQHFQQARKLSRHWKDPVFFEGVCYMVSGDTDQMLDCWNQLEMM